MDKISEHNAFGFAKLAFVYCLKQGTMVQSRIICVQIKDTTTLLSLRDSTRAFFKNITYCEVYVTADMMVGALGPTTSTLAV